jgi:hypothetical protein
MINYLSNSSQPYLFVNSNTVDMLYCYADHSIDLSFGNSSYTIRPWKIKKINLNDSVSTDVQTTLVHSEYGRAALECNPHIKIENNTIKLYYTVGFMKTEADPIKYHLCCMTADNLNLDNLRDFTVVHKTFSGTLLDNNYLLFVDKVYGKDVLVRKNINSNTADIIDTDYLNFIEILRITNVFNSDKVIVTGKTKEQVYVSYLLNSDLTIDHIITNSYNMNIYKCSILNNLLAYTVRNDVHKPEDVESRSIVVEGNVA